MKVVIGVGGSGSLASHMVKKALDDISIHHGKNTLGVSPVYENPASGGITIAPFANAAVVVEYQQSLETLWQTLHALERQQGRIRLLKTAPGRLISDIPWAERKSTQKWLQVPHPRFLSGFRAPTCIGCLQRGRVDPTRTLGDHGKTVPSAKVSSALSTNKS